MTPSADMPPRRVTASEERELLVAARKVERARKREEEALAERDGLIADILDDNARTSDVADILGLTLKAVRDARERARTAR